MSKSAGTLEQFFDDYIRNREIKNRAMSYEEYMRREGADYESAYRSGKEGAALERKKSYDAYGAEVEKLSDLGLSGGGYAEYMGIRADSEHSKKLDRLEEKRDDSARVTRGGYLDYLGSYTASQDRIKERVIRQLTQNEILDTEQAYKHAIDAGLEPTAARAATQSAWDATREKVRTRIISLVYDRELSPKQAANYAKEIGLPDEDVDQIMSLTKDFRFSLSQLSQSYLNFLERRASQATDTYGKATNNKK